MPKIKAVIFDMDGVLIDAKDWHYAALNRALGHFGFNISRYDHSVTFDGLPTRKKLEILTKSQGLPQSLHDFLNDLKQIYTMELVHTHCKPLCQHEHALSSLRAAGYKLAVASNSVRNSVEVMMRKSNLTPYLDTMVSNQDVKVGKPDPEIYIKTMGLLGVRPDESLVIEDHEYGIASARAAGAHLMIVQDIASVTLDNIRLHIAKAESIQ